MPGTHPLWPFGPFPPQGGNGRFGGCSPTRCAYIPGHSRSSAATSVALSAVFRGVDLGSWAGNDGHFHPYTMVVGSQALHAVGYAMGITAGTVLLIAAWLTLRVWVLGRVEQEGR